MTKEERLNKREQIRQEIIRENIFSQNYPIDKFEKYIDIYFDTYTSDELLDELINCGLKIKNN